MKPTRDPLHEQPAERSRSSEQPGSEQSGSASGRSRRVPLVAALAAVAVVTIAATAVLLSTLRGNDQGSPAAPGSTATPASPQASASLLPAAAGSPAAGVCGSTTGTVVTVRIEPDAPNPRCAAVTSAQSLRVVNATGDYGQPAHTITVTWIPHQSFTLRPGQAKTFPQHFGAYLAPGVHDLQSGPASRAQIWLR